MARILIAEDDPSMQNFLSLALARAGHDVACKNDGLDAYQALHSGDEYDLLLTDVVMPGMDGVELAQKAAVDFPNMKVMFITGFAAMAIEKFGKASTETPKMMSKPFHLNDLVEQVQAFLGENNSDVES